MRTHDYLFQLIDKAKTAMSIGNKIRKLLNESNATVDESYFIEERLISEIMYVFTMWRQSKKVED